MKRHLPHFGLSCGVSFELGTLRKTSGDPDEVVQKVLGFNFKKNYKKKGKLLFIMMSPSKYSPILESPIVKLLLFYFAGMHTSEV